HGGASQGAGGERRGKKRRAPCDGREEPGGGAPVVAGAAGRRARAFAGGGQGGRRIRSRESVAIDGAGRGVRGTCGLRDRAPDESPLTPDPTPGEGGPRASLRSLGESLLALLQTRFELAPVELREEGERRTG